MRTRRRTYTPATPSSLSLTSKHIIQSCTSNSRRNRGTKKRKCISNWDLDIPTEILQEILSRVGLKANIHVSLVCKTWFEAAVSVRKLQPRPWLLYPRRGTYVLFNTLRRRTYKKNFPELKYATFYDSRDGWLLVRTIRPWASFLFNPFTQERIDLPRESGSVIAFSAAPTSSSCLVISLVQQIGPSNLEIKTWHPGATVWTNHRFENQIPVRDWSQCVFSNGMFYFLSSDGCLGVFDPSRTAWNDLPVKPWSTYRFSYNHMPVLITEHEGDIFVIHIHCNNSYPSVFKLNLKQNLWEEKRDFGGLTVFARYSGSFARAGLSAEEKNRIYHYDLDGNGMYYYSQGDDKSSHPPSTPYVSSSVAWVDPPHNKFNL